MNRTVTAPSLRRAACSRYNDGTPSAPDPFEGPHTKDRALLAPTACRSLMVCIAAQTRTNQRVTL